MTRRAAKFRIPKKKCVSRISKRRPAKGSFRWIKRGSAYLLIACPVGKYNSRTKKCKVGTFAVEKVKARRGDACPVGYRKRR